MELRTWRSLPEFIEKCDFLALPPAGTAGASSAAHTAEAHANSSTPGTWPAEQQMPPASIAELLGFDDATGAAGIQKLEAAAEAGELVPGAARRNESRIVAALHQLTNITQAGQAMAGHDLHCWACTQPSGSEALRACRSRGRARKKPSIGARARMGRVLVAVVMVRGLRMRIDKCRRVDAPAVQQQPCRSACSPHLRTVAAYTNM